MAHVNKQQLHCRDKDTFRLHSAPNHLYVYLLYWEGHANNK